MVKPVTVPRYQHYPSTSDPTLYIYYISTKSIKTDAKNMDSAQNLHAALSQNESCTARPRTMAIQSLLNPIDNGRQSRAGSETVIADDDRSRGSTTPDSQDDDRPRQRSCEGLHRRISRTSPSNRERREFRPTYAKEEEYFIWYHRVDLGLDWSDVRQAYNAQFPHRQRKGFQGIQCKYYRCCEIYGVPRVRDRNRGASPAASYGVRSRLPGLWYPWMRCPPPPPGTTNLRCVYFQSSANVVPGQAKGCGM